MVSIPRSIDSVDLAKAYAEFDASLRVRQTKVISVMALTLVPACIGLDYLVYPQYLRQIFMSRMLSDVATLPWFLMLFTSFGKRHIKVLCNLPPMMPAIAITWMIYATEGMQSPYYAGLNIVMVAVVLLIPFTLSEAGIFCGFIILFYAAACALHVWYPPAGLAAKIDRHVLFNNLYFLGMTMVLSLTSAHFSSIRRFKEFSLRHELDVNNKELVATLKKLQETEVQLVQSEKMNALGKLSAGLLHEINNPLNFTFMALQVAQGEVGDNPAARETLADISQGMERIRSVISDLRAFAYPTRVEDAQEFRLEEAIESAIRLTAHELNGITIERRGTDCAVCAAKTQIVHVLMNLLVNSSHALRSKPLDRPMKIAISAETREGRVFVSVQDNGVGVPPELLPRLLDPFFTTKGPEEGTGLGLSICDTIVKNHNGQITIESEVGQWTKVDFDLPLPQAPAKAFAKESASEFSNQLQPA